MSSTIQTGLRIALALFVIVFGLNKFFHFIPLPAMTGDAGTLMGIYASSGFLKLIGVLEVLGGVALLAKKFMPLAITILTAIMFNAFLFHALHDPAGIGGAGVGLALSLLLVWVNKDRFSGLLSA